VNRFREVLWFNQEAFDQLLWWLMLLATIDGTSQLLAQANEVAGRLTDESGVIHALQRAGQESDYQVERLLAAVKD